MLTFIKDHVSERRGQADHLFEHIPFLEFSALGRMNKYKNRKVNR